MYGRETHAGAYKITRKLKWEKPDGEEKDPARQAAMMRHIYSLDTVLDIGETSAGNDWVARFQASKFDDDFTQIVISDADYNALGGIAPDEYAGAWCEDGNGQVVGRILQHTAPSRINEAWVVSIDWGEQDIHSESGILYVDAYRRYRIDKSTAFATVSPAPYAPGRIPEIPAEYEIVISEVDE
jgi:hypothetical protein